jgi:HTH-type transcriptional regulator/antitoxin HigA
MFGTFFRTPNTARDRGNGNKEEPMSATAAKTEYAALLSKSLPTVIQSEAENERYISLLEQIDGKGNRATTAERKLAELLTLLIEDFEERHYALKPADPVTVLNELIAANSLKQKDLTDVFGTPSIVSEILNGKRKLTTEHIRKLSGRFNVSPEVFF